MARKKPSPSTASSRLPPIKTEHGVDVNGQNGMKVTCNVNVKGMQGRTCHARLFIEHPQGTGWRDINGLYRSLNGTVSAGFNFVPEYPDCYYNNGFHISIPYSEIHLTPEKRTYYAKIVIYSGTGENNYCILGQSDYAPFDGWGGSNNVNNNNGNYQNNGGYTPQPYTPTQHANRCGPCGGTGKCSICYGSGVSPNHAAGIHAKCGGCGGSGICPTCRGTGISGYSYY